MGTREAFEKMISERGVYKKLGVTPSTVSGWKKSLSGKDKRGLSINKMEEMLIKGGYRVTGEIVWDIPIVGKIKPKSNTINTLPEDLLKM